MAKNRTLFLTDYCLTPHVHIPNAGILCEEKKIIAVGGASAFSALADLVASAISTAFTEHIEAARKANYFIFRDIPQGKYSPMYLKDMDVAAEKKDVKVNVK